jgi:hypothetical protein
VSSAATRRLYHRARESRDEPPAPPCSARVHPSGRPRRLRLRLPSRRSRRSPRLRASGSPSCAPQDGRATGTPCSRARAALCSSAASSRSAALRIPGCQRSDPSSLPERADRRHPLRRPRAGRESDAGDHRRDRSAARDEGEPQRLRLRGLSLRRRELGRRSVPRDVQPLARPARGRRARACTRSRMGRPARPYH